MNDKDKIFQMMCSPMCNIGVHLFKQNNLDFDQFIEYVLHKAKYTRVKLDPDFLPLYMSELKVLDKVLTVELLITLDKTKHILQIHYPPNLITAIILNDYGKRINEIEYYKDHFPYHSYNMLYEEYMLSKFKGSLKNRLKELFNKL